MKRWYECPRCSANLLMISESKCIEGVFIKCKRCRNEIEVVNNPNKMLNKSQSLHLEIY